MESSHSPVAYDGAPIVDRLLFRRVQGFAYYPEPIWRKKIADWCVFLVGHGVYKYQPR